MAPAWLQTFALQLSMVAAPWDFEDLERLEACREFCRNLCLALGFSQKTQCLCDLCIAITAAQVKMNGLPGNDINESSFGVLYFDHPMDSLKK